MVIPPLYWVDGHAVNQEPEMKVITGGQTRFPCIADYLSLGDRLPYGNIDAA